MNAYITSGNSYSNYANYGSYGNFGYGSNPALGKPSSLGAAPNAFLFPQDSVMLSGGPSAPMSFGVQDTCSCQFGNGASQEAFIVGSGDVDNPYQNFNATAMEVPAVNGANPQQALMALLEMLGITPEMLAALQAQGVNLMDLIAQANDMDDFGALQTGQEMLLPTTMPATGNGMPSIVYMPTSAPSQSQHGRRHRHHQPAAEPTPAPAPAPAPTTPPAPARPRHQYEQEFYVGNGRRVR